MELGMVGLGRMGGNMVRRLLRDGHRCVVYDRDPAAVAALVAEGAVGSASSDDLVGQMAGPRHVWIMVPAGAPTEAVMGELGGLLSADDAIIDGGNSHYVDDIRRSAALRDRGIHWIDCGTSGGVWGLERGYCLMIGGDTGAVQRLAPIWEALAPGAGDVARTPGRTGPQAPEEHGWLHCGPSGAGHFVKMVHNGIEYAIMASYAEGLNILAHAGAGLQARDHDAETAPLAHPELYQYELELDRVAEVWRRGSVIGSWLLDLTAAALLQDPQLSAFGGRVSDSGEGRWTLTAAIDTSAPAPVLSAALFQRFGSRGEDLFADQLQSAMRKQFGGHDEKPAAG
jgi:6-phosphogluconate dehydrogenase